ncbi:MAG: hypothetical protein ACREQL_04170, partial [Candidatus Binatia bacterium]
AERRWTTVRARGRVIGRLARRLRALYASGVPAEARERRRRALAARAAATLERRRLGGARDVSPPNNARLLGLLVYETDLDLFDDLAVPGRPLGPAITAMVRAARDAADPFDGVRGIRSRALQNDAARLDSGEPWRPSLSLWTSCSVGSPAGCGSWGMTSRTVRTCTARAWRGVRGTRAG